MCLEQVKRLGLVTCGFHVVMKNTKERFQRKRWLWSSSSWELCPSWWIFYFAQWEQGPKQNVCFVVATASIPQSMSEESKALTTCSKSSMATRMAKSRCMNLSHGFSRKIPSARLVMMWLMATVPGQCMQLLFCIVSRIWRNLSFCSQFDHRCYAFAGVGWRGWRGWGREGC